MKGNVYTRQKCPVCGGPMVNDERRGGCFCRVHQNIPASSSFFVKYPAKPPIQARFGPDYQQAARFLTGLQFKDDEGTLDPRDYRADEPLGLTTLSKRFLDIKAAQGLSKTSLSNLCRDIRRCQVAWGNRSIKTISNGDIEDFIFGPHENAKMGAMEISSKTRSEIRSAVNQFFRWACRREKIDMPEIPPVRFELGWRKIVDIETQQAIIDRVRKISWDVSPRIWLGIHILSHNQEVRPGELVKALEQDVLLEHGIIMIKWPKEGTLRGKHAHLWPEEIEIIRIFPRALPTVPFFRQERGNSGIVAGQQFGHSLWNKWVQRACEDIGVDDVGLYALVKHSTKTALSRELTPEQIRRGGSKHTSKAIERYLIPEIRETQMV